MGRKFSAKRAAALIALPFLAGCALADVEALRQAQPTGSPFTRALSDEYKRFALFEADEMHDWTDAGANPLAELRDMKITEPLAPVALLSGQR